MVIEFDPEFEMSPSRIDVLKALIDTDVRRTFATGILMYLGIKRSFHHY